MANFTLDSIREAADVKYASTDIDLGNGTVVSLLNPLRLAEENRSALMKIVDSLGEDDTNQGEVLAEAIRLVASDRSAAEELLALVGEDLAVLSELFTRYTGGVQVGEASASQD